MSEIFRRSEVANRWLEKLIAERFGHLWSIQYVDNKLVLQLRNSIGRIVFDQLENGFARDNSDFGCSYWHGQGEGSISPSKKPLPAPGGREFEETLIERCGADYLIHYDILGLVYWMLARIEEIGRINLDEFGRFPSTSSHAYRYDYLHRPLADEWLCVLGKVIKLRWPNIELKIPKFQTTLSHDVDRPYRYLFTSRLSIFRQCVADNVKRRNFGLSLERYGMWRSVRQGSMSADPYYSFDWIMDQSEKNDLSSAFYFICGNTNRKMDANYHIDSPIMRQLLRRIHARGHEIGLHPSFETYLRPECIKKEFEHLKLVCSEEGIRQSIWGGRMHYLRWEQETTMQAWADAGLNYDSTLGYADQPGFRCGSCFEYQAFDASRNKILDLRIRPLIAIDTSILSITGSNIESAFEVLKKLKTACKNVGGNFTLLWHNSELYSDNLKSLYQRILALHP